MNALRTALAAIAEHGASVLLGITVVLACGVVAMLCHRSPGQRRRLGVLTAVGVLLYLLVGIAPLPRLAARGAFTASPTERAALPLPAPVLDADARSAMLLRTIQGLTDPPGEGGVAPAPELRLAATPAAAEHPPSPFLAWFAGVPWSLLVAALYALGVVFWLVRTLGAQLRLAALLAKCRPVPFAALHLAGVPPGTRVVSTTHSLRPFCAGIRRPVIVLPDTLLAAECSAEATAVLRHEVAHVRAHDPRVWSLLAWLAVPLWCHPLFWWLCREVRFCSELLADDAAARSGDRQGYARALIDLAERSQHTAAAAGTVAIFHRPSEFYRRIQMLLSRQGPLSTKTSRVRRFAQSFSMLCLVGAAASAFGVPASAQDPERSLQRENADLRATLDMLRAELATLRDQIAALRASAAVPHQDVDPLIQGWIAKLQPPGHEDKSANPALPEPSQDPAAGVGSAPVQDPLASPPDEVPMLGRLPLLGNLFQRAAEAREVGQAATPTPERPGSLPLAQLPNLRMGSFDERGIFTPALRDYVVRKGDSLELIARRELGSAERSDEIMTHNEGLDPRRLRVGQTLKLPVFAFPPIGATPPPGADVAPLAAAPDEGGDHARVRELLAERGFGQPENTPTPSPAPTGVAALAELTSRYLDLQAELEMQKTEAAEAKKMAEVGHTTQRDARRAEVTLRATEKKLAIASRLIDGEIAATESELRWLEKRRAECSPTEAMQLDVQFRRARTRMEALQAVK